MQESRTRREALSLPEVLVLIAVVAVVTGIVLPAVQKVRASSQRADCANRMRQIGLALHNYHSVQLRLPAGMSLNAAGAYPYLSWNARILPYLEQAELWQSVQAAYASDPSFLHVPPHAGRGIVVNAFTCPSDGRSASAATLMNGTRVAFTDYLGVEGTDQSRRDGTLYLDSQVRFGDVSDGTSSTLLVGERPPSTDNEYGWWYAGWGQDQDGSAEMVLGVRELLTAAYDCPHGPGHFQPGSYSNQCDFLHFWSLHPGGANFLFADGTVRFLGYEADRLLPALATRAGGEDVAVP